MKRIAYILFGVLLAILFTSCTTKQLTVKDAWAREGSAGANSAAYMTIKNPTGKDDVLLNASSTATEHVELHMTTMDDQGVMSMEHQENIPVSKGSQVELKPGGYHIMLIGLTQELVAGKTLPLTLTFQNAGDITIEVPILSP